MIDLADSPADAAFRAEARAWLRAHAPRDLPSGDTREGFALHRDWEKTLFDAGWAVVSWPEAYGGRGSTPWQWLIFEEEYWAAGCPQRVAQNGIFLLAPTLFEHGTDEQRDRLLRPMARGEFLWAQAWSEPGAGSDLASLRSTGTRVDGGWRLNGQKTWCTRAAFCDGVFGLFRTHPDQPRHKGLTYLMAPLDAPGVTVRGFERLDGDEGFAEVFFDDVFVPDRDVIGQPGAGWYAAMSTASSERGLTLRSPGRFLATAERLLDLWRQRGDPTDTAMADRVVQGWIDAQAYHLRTLEQVGRMVAGEPLGAEQSMGKLWWSEMDVRLHEVAMDLCGEDPDPGWYKGWQFALAGPIYAGTNEVQRGIVADRVLGLPRDRRR